MSDTIEFKMPYRDTKEIVICNHGWRNINIQFPAKKGHYLVIYRNINNDPRIKITKVGKWRFGSRLVFLSAGSMDETITHWMPLPEIPNENS